MLTDAEKELLNRASGSYRQQAPFGELLHKKPLLVKGKYSFAIQGGAVGSFNFLSDLSDTNSTISIPNNAIIVKAWVDILTAMASAGGTGTIAISSEGAGDLLAAVDADTLSGIVAGVPDGTAANMIKMTASRTLVGAIATEGLTAGIFNVFVEYVLSD